MTEFRELLSYIPDRGYLDQSHGVVFHYTPFDTLPWIISRNEGIISLANAHRTGRPISSEHMVSVQGKNDRPEWISTYDADNPHMPWNEVLPYGHVTLIATKEGLPLVQRDAQHKLPGEVWVDDWIQPEKIEGILVKDWILDMNVADFLEREISDVRYEKAYARYSEQARKGDRDLNQRIIDIMNRLEKEVDQEMPHAYLLLKGQEVERRKKKAVVIGEFQRQYLLDFQVSTVEDWFKFIAKDQKKKLWKVSIQEQNGEDRKYIERIDTEF